MARTSVSSTLLALLLVAVAASRAGACGYHDPKTIERGSLNWIYPESLHVTGAVWRQQQQGLLDGPDLILMQARGEEYERLLREQYRTTTAALSAFGAEMNEVEVPAGMPNVSLALIEPMLWTRFVNTSDGVQIEHHTDSATKGDLVVITDVPVLEAIDAGKLTVADAHTRGLLRMYGPEEGQRVLLATHGAIGSKPLADIGPGAPGYLPEDLTLSWRELLPGRGDSSPLRSRQIRIPGYILPLASREGRVTEFLLVP